MGQRRRYLPADVFLFYRAAECFLARISKEDPKDAQGGIEIARQRMEDFLKRQEDNEGDEEKG